MATRPKLSIIMPTYNGVRFLSEQIDSILAQEDGDFELVITDDGSTDGTRALTESYAAQDRRIRLIPSTGNLGQNIRLGQLIGEARGAYVAISDQDDRWASDRNRRLFDAMGGRPMALGRSELIDGEGRPKGHTLLQRIPPAGWRPGPDVRLRAFVKPMFSAHATIVAREFINMGALSFPMPFDWLMGLEALFAGGLAYEDEAAVFHRIHGGNQVNNIAVGSRKLRPSPIHYLSLFRRPARLNLWLLFHHLGSSPNLDGASAAMFRKLAARCHAAWFAQWRNLRTDGGIRTLLIDTLAPFAASPEDHDDFAAHVRLLTAPKASRIFANEVRRRLGTLRQGDV